MRTFVHAFLMLLLGIVGALPAMAEAPPPQVLSVALYDAKGNGLPDHIWLERGVPKEIRAKAFAVGGVVVDVPIQWVVDPSNVARIVTVGNGSVAQLTALRDLFDDPRRLEPWTNVRACVGGVCKWMLVSSVVSLSGSWKVDIDVTDVPFGLGDQTREMIFRQDGANLLAYQVGKDAGSKPMVAVIRGRQLDFKDPNKKLTRFFGLITDRRHADGSWQSDKGHEGYWHGSWLHK